MIIFIKLMQNKTIVFTFLYIQKLQIEINSIILQLKKSEQ